MNEQLGLVDGRPGRFAIITLRYPDLGMDWGVSDKGGLIQGCKAGCKLQESGRPRLGDKQQPGLGDTWDTCNWRCSAMLPMQQGDSTADGRLRRVLIEWILSVDSAEARRNLECAGGIE